MMFTLFVIGCSFEVRHKRPCGDHLVFSCSRRQLTRLFFDSFQSEQASDWLSRFTSVQLGFRALYIEDYFPIYSVASSPTLTSVSKVTL